MRLHPGEVEAAGWRVERLSGLLERLRAAAPDVTGRPRIVAIDGRGGAGKSTLVERLRALVPASGVVHTDDVAWNQAYFDWGDLMVENILRPLRRGEAVDFRPPAWIAHGRPGTIRVPAGTDVVWVEGTGIIREELAPWIDASIWLQGDLDEQERRLVARDGDSAEQREHVAAWLAEELPLMLREQPWRRATVVVAGTPQLDHDPATEVVVAPPCWGMTDPELSALRHRAAHGDRDALDELIELASERGDADELRRLADAGSTTATDELIQLSSERGDLRELRRLADGGNATATDELIELATERGDLAELGRLADAGSTTAADQLLELRSE